MTNSFPKSTKEEIEQTKKMLEEKYDIIIQNDSLLKITGLLKEFGFYLKNNGQSVPKNLSDEIKGIIIEHRPIPYEPIVEEKTAKLFKLQYDVSLAQNQIEQVVQFLTRKLWSGEGFDASLDKALDDLLIYIDKRIRGKRVNGLNLHNALRKALDETMGRLNTTNLGWERIYKENRL